MSDVNAMTAWREATNATGGMAVVFASVPGIGDCVLDGVRGPQRIISGDPGAIPCGVLLLAPLSRAELRTLDTALAANAVHVLANNRVRRRLEVVHCAAQYAEFCADAPRWVGNKGVAA